MEKLIEALQIFLKYGNPQFPTQCEHDRLYICIDPALVTSQDIEILDKMGFDISEDGDTFVSYLYGAA